MNGPWRNATAGLWRAGVLSQGWRLSFVECRFQGLIFGGAAKNKTEGRLQMHRVVDWKGVLSQSVKGTGNGREETFMFVGIDPYFCGVSKVRICREVAICECNFIALFDVWFVFGIDSGGVS